LTLPRDTLKLHGGTMQCPFTETDVQRVTQVSETHGYREAFEAAGNKVMFFSAGHIPGSAHVLVDDGETRLLYTGDFHTGDQQLLSGTTARPEVEVAITESQIVRRHPEFVRDPEALRRAKSNARFVTGRDGQRKRIADQNTVVVTTSGMLSGGPAMTYVPATRANPTNKITFTGYQVEGTPGRELLDNGRAEIDGRVMPVSAQVEAYDFSAHADREGLLEFLKEYRDARILVNHGDECQQFAEEIRGEGFEASAPDLGETVEIEV
jgi:putative mRNA 3-end processing factor